jgi:fatty-acyl-CoA synthase
LINYPLVKEVSVIGLPDEKWGESVCAVIVSENEEEIDTNELKAYCIEKLGRYKVPRKFIFIKQLPKTHVGKIDKKQLIVEFS